MNLQKYKDSSLHDPRGLLGHQQCSQMPDLDARLYKCNFLSSFRFTCRTKLCRVGYTAKLPAVVNKFFPTRQEMSAKNDLCPQFFFFSRAASYLRANRKGWMV